MQDNRKKVGFITLGITLIFAGCVMILSRYSNSAIFKDIFLLWPLFLIILGLEFIITKLYNDAKKREVQLSPSGISIFLIILILFTSFLFTNVNLSFPRFENGIFSRGWSKYDDVVNRTVKIEDIEAKDLTKLIIENPRGDVHVQPSDSDLISLEIDYKIATNDKESLEDLIDDLVEIKRATTSLIRVKDLDGYRHHSLQAANIKIKVPDRLELDVETSFGDVLVSAMKNNVAISNEHGKVDLSDIKGDVIVKSEYGPVKVKEIKGSLDLSNSYDKIQVQDIGGSAKVKNMYSETEIENIEKDLWLTTKHGKATVKNVKASADIGNEYGPTLVYNISGDLKIDAKHSELDIRDVLGNIEAKTSYSPIKLENDSYENADIRVETSYSKISADNAVGLTTSDKNNRQEGSAKNGNGGQKISLSNQYGDIKIFVR